MLINFIIPASKLERGNYLLRVLKLTVHDNIPRVREYLFYTILYQSFPENVLGDRAPRDTKRACTC